MHTTTLRKVGGSIMLAVPPALLKTLQLQDGSAVELTLDNGRLIIAPASFPHYSLDELLAQCDGNAEINAEDLAWIDDNPTGNELL
nr:AbrB/MazE/SpoVT family DNA-binding domain-containing protein [uncultured Desulfuromonas sp.]